MNPDLLAALAKAHLQAEMACESIPLVNTGKSYGDIFTEQTIASPAWQEVVAATVNPANIRRYEADMALHDELVRQDSPPTLDPDNPADVARLARALVASYGHYPGEAQDGVANIRAEDVARAYAEDGA